MRSSKKSLRKTPAKLKKRLWKIFSEYIRIRYADKNGIVRCVTCGDVKHYKEMQAGHYIHAKESIKFDEMNVHVQCPRCNLYLHGNGRLYERFMQDRYGMEAIIDLELRGNQVKKLGIGVLEDMIDKYKNTLKYLKAGRIALP